jgi:hypothetical protein
LGITDLILWIGAIRIGPADVVAFAQPGARVALEPAAALFVAGALHTIADGVAKHTGWAIVILCFYRAFSRPRSLAAARQFVAQFTGLASGFWELLCKAAPHGFNAIKMNTVAVEPDGAICPSSTRQRVRCITAKTEGTKAV